MRRHITRMVEDVLSETVLRLQQDKIASPDDVRDNAREIVAFSEGMRQAVDETRRFLFRRVYRDETVMRVMRRAEGVVERLFAAYVAAPYEMGKGWAGEDAAVNGTGARTVADYLAGMTDTYALAEYRRLFDETVDLR